jgi:hypothetical protein
VRPWPHRSPRQETRAASLAPGGGVSSKGSGPSLAARAHEGPSPRAARLAGLSLAIGLALAPAFASATAPVELSTPAIPDAHGDAAPRAAGQPTTLFINFDGAVLRSGCGNDALRDCSTLSDLFDGYVGPFPGNMIQKISILQAVRKDLEDFGVVVVTERPADDVDYTMILYGDLGEQSFAGIAPYIDCGDLWPNDTAFANAYGTSNTGSTIVLQEAAHTWGLEHVNAPGDNMHPFKTVASQSFTDTCEKIVANTDLEESGGACNQVHTRYCELGHQNSWQEMRGLFGPPVADVTPPTLAITSPEPGSTHVLPVDLPLRGIIGDDRHLQLYDIAILQGGEVLLETTDVHLDQLMRDPPAGDYELAIRVADEAGNMVEESVAFTILPEGSELPEEPAEDVAEADGCRIAGDGDGGALFGVAALLPLAWLRRRKRR